MDKSTLTLSPDEMAASLERVSKIIVHHFTHLPKKPVARQKTRRELQRFQRYGVSMR